MLFVHLFISHHATVPFHNTTIHQLLIIFFNPKVALVSLAKKNTGVIVPGYTHLQRAQPVLLQHHLLAYVEQVLF